jgi:acyl dehydratase
MGKENWNKLLSDEFNQQVDEWADSRNALIGDTSFPSGVGNVKNPWGPVKQYGSNEYYATFNEEINRDLIRHFCNAIGDKNPLFRFDEYGKQTRYGGVIAPNGILICIGEGGAGQGKVAPGFGRSLAGGSTWTWHKLIRPGDTFHVMGTDMGVKEKTVREGKPYRLFQSIYRTTYLNQRDELVATRDRTRMNIVAESRSETEKAFDVRPRHQYTQEELDRIFQAYQAEETNRRGGLTRFWEAVVEGEELTPIMAGPFTILDSAVWIGAMGQHYSFGIVAEMIKGNEQKHGWFDAETNTWRWRAEGHLADAAGKATGLLRGAYGHHGQFESLMQKAIQNWMGDDGFLKMQSNRTRRPSWIGDTTTVKGKVTKKYKVDDQFLVDLEVYCENQDGEVHQECDATVILPSRTNFLYEIK